MTEALASIFKTLSSYSFSPVSILLGVCSLGVFFYGLYRNNDKFVFPLIAQGIFLDIICVQKGGSVISFLKLAGIFLFFIQIKDIKRNITYLSIRILYLICFISFLTGSYFTFIAPWDVPDFISGSDGGLFSYITQVSLVLSVTGLSIYLGQFLERSSLSELKIFFPIIVLCILGIYLEKIFSFDFLSFFSGRDSFEVPDRMHGFVSEPRRASYCVVLIFIASTFLPLSNKFRIPILFSLAYAFYLSFSMTGLVLSYCLLPLLIVIGFFLQSDYFRRTLIINSVVLLALTFYVFSVYQGFQLNKEKSNIEVHLKNRIYIFQELNFINKLEFTDSAPLNFFTKNPHYLIFGVGTGQSVNAAKNYLSPRKQHLKHRLIPPVMGSIRILTSGGIVLLCMYFLFILKGLKDTFSLNLSKENRDRLFTVAMVITIAYLLQIGTFHPLAFGIFIFADLIKKKQSSNNPIY